MKNKNKETQSHKIYFPDSFGLWNLYYFSCYWNLICTKKKVEQSNVLMRFDLQFNNNEKKNIMTLLMKEINCSK